MKYLLKKLLFATICFFVMCDCGLSAGNNDEKQTESFLEKIAGVWGVTDTGVWGDIDYASTYYMYFDGSTIYRGWMESDALPISHVIKVMELSEDKFEVTIAVDPDPFADDEDAPFTYSDPTMANGYEETFIIDGSYDSFKSVVVLQQRDSESLMVKMGNNMDEAFANHFDFFEKYEDLKTKFIGNNQLKTALSTCIISDEGSSAHSTWSFEIELPNGDDMVSSAIRSELLNDADSDINYLYDFKSGFTPYDGDLTDYKTYVRYYIDEAKKVLESESDELAESDEFPFSKTEYTFSLLKTFETDTYIVFCSKSYDYSGGAHGQMSLNAYTFDKQMGEKCDKFIDPDSVKELQPLLLSGLRSYSEEYGFDFEDAFDVEQIVPLPKHQPYPSEEGLVFTYGEYEITAYAYGMPTFTIPFRAVAPYLTVEARQLLGL